MSTPFRVEGDELLLRVKVLPNAGRNQLAGLRGEELAVRLAAQPRKGRWNKAQGAAKRNPGYAMKNKFSSTESTAFMTLKHGNRALSGCEKRKWFVFIYTQGLA